MLSKEYQIIYSYCELYKVAIAHSREMLCLLNLEWRFSKRGPRT